jgi:class 3 adenylate cyclase
VAQAEAIQDTLQRAREAVERCAWLEAFELYGSLDAEFEARDLEGLAEAAWWTGRMDVAIDARERAYAAHIVAGSPRRAAVLAMRVARDHEHKRSNMSRGWLNRAERLLEQEPDCVEQGYLERSRAHQARLRGDLDTAVEHARKTIEVGTRFGDPNLIALGLYDQGNALVEQGHVDEGFALLDESTVAAVSGELDPHTTAIVYCGIITSCRDLGDYARAGDWTDAAKRWCERQAISGFPGVCRVFRAEIMRLRGNWLDAEEEVGLACSELRDFAPAVAGHGFYELGELRLRMGDLDAAEDAFRQAHALGREPQPGLALLQLARGEVDTAARSIGRVTDEESPTRLARARLLPAQVQIALAAGDGEQARAAAAELEHISEEYGSPALGAAAATARGAVQLDGGEAHAAIETLKRARRLWQEIDAPYEAAQTRILLAEAYAGDGDRAAAELELRAGRDAFANLGAVRDASHAGALLERVSGGEARRAVRTFVFTDICDSTPLVEAIGDEAWRNLVSWHDRTLRTLFAEHDGEEIDHAGDGFFVAFDDASAALACAVAVQRRLAAHRQEHGFAPQVRIGLHATEASEAGGAYRGKGVHEAARIGALAGASEIVASAATVEGRNGPAHSTPRAVTLKGMSAPLDVVSVDWR